MKKVIKLGITLFSITTILNGCTSYVQPDPSSESVAYVKETFVKSTVVDIEKINGTSTHNLVNMFRNPFTNSDPAETFTIKPGPCTLNLYYSNLNGSSSGKVNFNAIAGKKYKADASLDGYHVYFHVVEEASGKIVSEK